MSLSTSRHRHGIVVAENENGHLSAQLALLRGARERSFIVRGFRPSRFRRSSGRQSHCDREQGRRYRPVSDMESAVSVKNAKVECAINAAPSSRGSTVLASFDQVSVRWARKAHVDQQFVRDRSSARRRRISFLANRVYSTRAPNASNEVGPRKETHPYQPPESPIDPRPSSPYAVRNREARQSPPAFLICGPPCAPAMLLQSDRTRSPDGYQARED